MNDPIQETKYLRVLVNEQKSDLPVGANSENARLGIEILLNAKVLNSLAEDACNPVHYDLLVVCAAVEYADKRWRRSKTSWGRRFHLTIPVIDTDKWQMPEVETTLRKALNFLTGDKWDFEFVQSTNTSPLKWRQLPVAFSRSVDFAIAYSDGLDSKAVAGLMGSDDRALRIRVSSTKAKTKSSEVFFNQIPFKVQASQHRESSFRSRGFKFAALTAIAAHLTRLNRIVVPESGQGALGPVLMPLYQTYADYRNHPVFFRKMEQFLYELLSHSFAFEQPRIWSTKGETLRAYLATGRPPATLLETRSCWQSRSKIVNRGERMQCGLCAACVLRRVSMNVAQVQEPLETYAISDLSASSVGAAFAVLLDPNDRALMVNHGSTGVRYFHRLADMRLLPDSALDADVAEIATSLNLEHGEALEKLRRLLSAHAAEWQTFLAAQGPDSFLNSWINGGVYARSERA